MQHINGQLHLPDLLNFNWEAWDVRPGWCANNVFGIPLSMFQPPSKSARWRWVCDWDAPLSRWLQRSEGCTSQLMRNIANSFAACLQLRVPLAFFLRNLLVFLRRSTRHLWWAIHNPQQLPLLQAIKELVLWLAFLGMECERENIPNWQLRHSKGLSEVTSL